VLYSQIWERRYTADESSAVVYPQQKAVMRKVADDEQILPAVQCVLSLTFWVGGIRKSARLVDETRVAQRTSRALGSQSECDNLNVFLVRLIRQPTDCYLRYLLSTHHMLRLSVAK